MKKRISAQPMTVPAAPLLWFLFLLSVVAIGALTLVSRALPH